MRFFHGVNSLTFLSLAKKSFSALPDALEIPHLAQTVFLAVLGYAHLAPSRHWRTSSTT